MSGASQRTYLGSAHSLAERVRVYRALRWLEIDHLDYTDVERRRIPFAEIELVTLHARTGGFWAWAAASFAALFVVLATALAIETGFRYTLAGLAFLFGLVAGFSFVVPSWTVTVFGRRTSARIVFRLRGGKAREVYAEIGRLAQEARQALRLGYGAEPSPWAPPPPGSLEEPPA